jgi:hypothetical protein
MELMELKQQVCPRSKVLSENNTRQMIKVTAVPPAERQNRIKQNLKDRSDAFKKDEYAQAFGITVNDQFASINARVLDAPSLIYTDKIKPQSKLNEIRPQIGCKRI